MEFGAWNLFFKEEIASAAKQLLRKDGKEHWNLVPGISFIEEGIASVAKQLLRKEEKKNWNLEFGAWNL